MNAEPDPLQRAVALHQAGRFAEAEALYRQVLAADPGDADALNLLGVLRLRAGDGPGAVALLERATRAAPTAAPMHNNLGNALRETGALDRAVAAYAAATRLRPDYTLAWLNLGRLEQVRGRHESALAAFVRAAAADPASAPARVGQGEALLHLGRAAHARAAFAEAARLGPRDADAARGLAAATTAAGDLPGAIGAWQRALALAPDDPVALLNLGNVLQASGRAPEAVAAFRRLVARTPDDAEAWHNLGAALEATGEVPESVRCLEEALARNPRLASTLAHLVNQKQHLCDWEGLAELQGRLIDAVDAADANIDAPFALLSVPTSAAQQLAVARRHAARIAAAAGAMSGVKPPSGAQPAGAGRSAHERIRVGYLSADFHEHATAYLVAELFERHDRTRVEVVVLSYGPDDGSATRRRIVAAADRFVELATLSDAEAAARIRASGVDLLVDVKGYTRGARPGIAARRPAPVQAQWLAYPGTLGADWFDYAIVDPVVAPAGEETSFSENLVRLPCYWVNDTRRPVAPVPARAAAGLPDDAFVFCCFNQSYKILPERFDAWMRLLAAVPDALLWLLRCNDPAVDHLRAQASRQGVDPARLVFAPQVPVAEHCARIACADLALDTLPYNGHTTTNDALWAGVPVVTEAGSTFAGRVAASQLRAVGLPELVTASLADYEALARHLAMRREDLHALRARLASLRMTAPLFDTSRFARTLEEAYAAIWARHLSGAPPAPVTVGVAAQG